MTKKIDKKMQFIENEVDIFLINENKIIDLLNTVENVNDFSYKIGISRQYFYLLRANKENNIRNIGVQILTNIAIYFNHSIGFFFDEPDMIELERENAILKEENNRKSYLINEQDLYIIGITKGLDKRENILNQLLKINNDMALYVERDLRIKELEREIKLFEEKIEKLEGKKESKEDISKPA
jgi:transcriptional regulator with XRE-family HTH domain